MRSGFTFNGRHTSEFGVTAKTKERPIFPTVKEQVYSSAEMDGEYDFTDVSGREYFETRKFQVELQLAADSLTDLQNRMSRISRWLKGRSTLIFDDMPLVKWNVRVIDSVSYMPENGGRKAVLSVTYKAMPFSDMIYTVIDGPCLEADVELNANIPLSAAEYLTFSGGGTYTGVPNVGDVHVKPVITVTGSDGSFTIKNNGAGIAVKYKGDFVIDCEKEQVYSADGTSLMPYVAGDFFELRPGLDNTIELTGGSVQINYTPQFLYNADLNNTEWGD